MRVGLLRLSQAWLGGSRPPGTVAFSSNFYWDLGHHGCGVMGPPFPLRVTTGRAAWGIQLSARDQLTSLCAERGSGIVCSPVTLEMAFSLCFLILQKGHSPSHLGQAQVFIKQLLVRFLHLPELGSVLTGIPWGARQIASLLRVYNPV